MKRLAGFEITYRAVILAAAGAALVTAVFTGLAHIGWNTPSRAAATAHGPTMVLGFLGTVIGTERAVALGRRWAWLVPASAAAAVMAGFFGLATVASLLILLAGLGLVAVFVVAHRIQPDPHLWIMGAGAVSWVVAALGLVSGSLIVAIVPSLAGFLILTIVGERFELSRLLQPTGARIVWILVVSAFIVCGAAIALLSLDWGARIAGVGMIGCALWLSRFDVARRTIRFPGVTRYMAFALLAGYVWLLLAGIVWTSVGISPGTGTYDIALHAVFLGFVFSMVFAHAPVIVPAITRLRFPFTYWLWVPLVVLHASLLLRVLSDFGNWQEGRMWGGLFNAISIGIFIITALVTMLRGRREMRSPASEPSLGVR